MPFKQQHQITIVFEPTSPVSVYDACQYVREAVAHYGKMQEPDDAFFGVHIVKVGRSVVSSVIVEPKQPGIE